MDDESLIAEAARHAGEFALAKPSLTAGTVACALLTAAGNVYTGINIDLACGIGFCAEHAAVAAMLNARETRVAVIVAVNHRGRILPPCGRCRELLAQVDRANRAGCRVLLPPAPVPMAVTAAADPAAPTPPCRAALLGDLLPEPWMEGK
ncbi:MAG TPA: cytidine deaminase [Armatimonadaceae bacterium]|nr:cytidine deaminase [Armatimonadaceae bacterium]